MSNVNFKDIINEKISYLGTLWASFFFIGTDTQMCCFKYIFLAENIGHSFF